MLHGKHPVTRHRRGDATGERCTASSVDKTLAVGSVPARSVTASQSLVLLHLLHHDTPGDAFALCSSPVVARCPWLPWINIAGSVAVSRIGSANFAVVQIYPALGPWTGCLEARRQE